MSTDFNHENWKPPSQEVRELRRDFYAPIVDEMVRKAAEEKEEALGGEGSSKRGGKASYLATGDSEKQRMKNLDTGHRTGNSMEDLLHDKWFTVWQDKECVKVDPPRSNGDDEDDPPAFSAAPISLPTGATERPGRPGRHPCGSADRAKPGTAKRSVPGPSLPSTPSSVSGADPQPPPRVVGMRLICFPWEGGGPGIFEALSGRVRATQVVAVTYPGRLNRCHEPWPAGRPAPRSGGLVGAAPSSRSSSSDPWNLRGVAAACGAALVSRGLVDAPFALLGHGMGALVAYEVAKVLRRDYGDRQPALFFALHAAGPQASTGDDALDSAFDDDDEDGEDEDGEDGSGSDAGSVGGGGLCEASDDYLYEHLVTLERGGLPALCTDQKELFKVGLPVYRADLRAMAAYKYESDWPFARPFFLVPALYCGRVGRGAMRAWEMETTKPLGQYECIGGARSMLRDAALTHEFAQWLDGRVTEELARPFDPEEEKLDLMARGLLDLT